jgi:hypothetical protein
LRLLLALMVVANLLFLAWSQGALDRIIGVSSLGDREPERMGREVNPDAVNVILPPQAASGAAAGETACLESGPYSPAEVALAEVGLSAVISPGSWVNLRQDRPGEWVVYLGPFADPEALARKEEEVKRTRVPYEAIKERGELDYGLSLGRHGQLSEANAALARLSQQAPLRNARVVNLRQPATAHVLRVEAAGSAVALRLQGLADPAVKPFASCLKR